MTTSEYSMDFDDTIKSVGSFGPFQLRLTILVCSLELIVALHSLTPVFIAYSPPHWCATPEIAANSTCTEEQLRHLTSPLTHTKDDSGDDVITYDSCKRYDHDYLSLTATPGCDVTINSSSSLVECDAWDYDRSHMIETTVTDFNLVCGRASLASMVGGMFLIAECVGYFVFGAITDRLGRRFTLLIGGFLGLCIGVGTYFAPTFNIFMGLRIAQAFANAAVAASALIILMEFVGAQYRVLIGVIMGSMWGIAPHLLTGMAYLSKEWRHMHLLLAIPTVVSIITIYLFVLESPRWLIVRGRKKEAGKVFAKMAKVNGYNWNTSTQTFIQEERNESIVTMLTTPSFLYISFVQYVSWFASGLMYYGLVFNSPNLGSNPFVSYSISSIIDAPCLIPLLVLFTWVGRILPLSIGNFLGGVFFLLTIVTDGYWLQITLVMLAKGCITACFTGIWIYANEVYPTSVRSSSSSLSYIATGIGSSLGAYVWYLEDIYVHLPIFMCAGFVMLAGVLNMTLPETLGASLTQTIEEGDRFVKELMCGVCRGKTFEGRRKDKRDGTLMKKEKYQISKATSV